MLSDWPSKIKHFIVIGSSGIHLFLAASCATGHLKSQYFSACCAITTFLFNLLANSHGTVHRNFSLSGHFGQRRISWIFIFLLTSSAARGSAIGTDTIGHRCFVHSRSSGHFRPYLFGLIRPLSVIEIYHSSAYIGRYLGKYGCWCELLSGKEASKRETKQEDTSLVALNGYALLMQRIYGRGSELVGETEAVLRIKEA